MRTLFVLGVLLLLALLAVSPAMADRGGHGGGHFGGGHFHHFGHPRVFIGGYFGYPYYSYPYGYSPYAYPYGYSYYPPPGAYGPDVYAEPPAGGMVDQNGNGVPGQGF